MEEKKLFDSSESQKKVEKKVSNDTPLWMKIIGGILQFAWFFIVMLICALVRGCLEG